MKKLRGIRTDYNKASLLDGEIPENPYNLLCLWMDSAIAEKIPEPTAICLSTIKPNGRVNSRIVLAKEIQEDGVVFFTNYNSAKGQDIAKNSFACAVFFWAEMQRQIRIEGTIKKISEKDSDEYYMERPKLSKIGAWASPQSQVIQSRSELEQLVEKFQKEFEQKELGRPPFWGGYKLNYESIEFWQGRQGRLHDRFLYTKKLSTWKICRLAP